MPYVTHFPHMTEEEDRAYFEELRRIGPGGRMEISMRLTREMRREVWESVKAQNPSGSEREWQVAFVRTSYGDELADRFEAALKEKGLWKQPIRSGPFPG